MYSLQLEATVNHSDESYNCKKMSACPYTGTTIINKIPWAGEAGETQEEDQAEESDTNREEDREEEIIIEEPAAQEVEENVEMARGDWPADSEGERRECCDLSNIL